MQALSKSMSTIVSTSPSIAVDMLREGMLGQLVQLMHQRRFAHKAVNPGDAGPGTKISAYDGLTALLLPIFASIPQVRCFFCQTQICSPLLLSSYFASSFVVHSSLCEHLEL